MDADRTVSSPSTDHRAPFVQMESLSRDTRPVAHVAARNLLRNLMRSSGALLCDGPSIAIKLRCVIESLAVQEKDLTLIRLAGRCCARCRSKIDVLDEMIDDVIRVTSLLKNLTDHENDGLMP